MSAPDVPGKGPVPPPPIGLPEAPPIPQSVLTQLQSLEPLPTQHKKPVHPAFPLRPTMHVEPEQAQKVPPAPPVALLAAHPP